MSKAKCPLCGKPMVWDDRGAVYLHDPPAWGNSQPYVIIDGLFEMPNMPNPGWNNGYYCNREMTKTPNSREAAEKVG